MNKFALAALALILATPAFAADLPGRYRAPATDDYAPPPMFITENGGAFADPLVDGQVHDADRTAYLQSHIAAVADASEVRDVIEVHLDLGGYPVVLLDTAGSS